VLTSCLLAFYAKPKNIEDMITHGVSDAGSVQYRLQPVKCWGDQETRDSHDDVDAGQDVIR
jgi:hypothetical protein